MAEKIGDWTTSVLVKFVQDLLRNNPPQYAVSQTIEKLTCTTMLTVQDQMQFSRNKYTVGGTGTAAALPANPVGYFEVLDPFGNVMLIPYFNNG